MLLVSRDERVNTPMNASELRGKWMIDLDSEQRNNPMPIWAKNVWDCRLLIVDTSRYTHESKSRLALAVIYGFQLPKYMNGENLVLTDIPGHVPGYISDVTFKDKEVWTWEHRATLLDESKPNLKISLGQATLF